MITNGSSTLDVHNKTGWQGLRSIGERFRKPAVDSSCKLEDDFVGRLFGELTHFSFVVELGDKRSRERNKL